MTTKKKLGKISAGIMLRHMDKPKAQKPETLSVLFDVVEATPKDVVCHSPITGNFMVISRTQFNTLDAAQPKMGLCPSCGKEYDSCRATGKGCEWYCHDCREKDKAEIRAEGIAQGAIGIRHKLIGMRHKLIGMRREAEESGKSRSEVLAYLFEWWLDGGEQTKSDEDWLEEAQKQEGTK